MSPHPAAELSTWTGLWTSLQELKRNLIRAGKTVSLLEGCALICSTIRNGTAVRFKLLKSSRLKNHIRKGNSAKTCIGVQTKSRIIGPGKLYILPLSKAFTTGAQSSKLFILPISKAFPYYLVPESINFGSWFC